MTAGEHGTSLLSAPRSVLEMIGEDHPPGTTPVAVQPPLLRLCWIDAAVVTPATGG